MSVNNWLLNNEHFHTAVTKDYNHLHSKEVTQTCALALGMEEYYFDRMCISLLVCASPTSSTAGSQRGEEPGIAAHTDFMCVTILCQGQVEGSEVLNNNGIGLLLLRFLPVLTA